MKSTSNLMRLALPFWLLWPGLTIAEPIVSKDEINASSFVEGEALTSEAGAISPLVLKIQVLLDRSGISPGVIDGIDGENVRKAVKLFESANDLPVDGELDQAVWDKLVSGSGEEVVGEYTISEEDASQPFVNTIPDDYAEKAKLDALSYTSILEMLAERFHMDEDLLRALNPDADFESVGTTVIVANPESGREAAKVERITVSGADGTLIAYDSDGRIKYAYPATVGSTATPSPSGTHEVLAVAVNPTYTYNPSKNFQQGDNDQVLTIPAGPNGPVGSIWIDLSKPTYGIHGTPDPAKISKTQSHGCVRLTNWDAAELSEAVSKGTVVEFMDGG